MQRFRDKREAAFGAGNTTGGGVRAQAGGSFSRSHYDTGLAKCQYPAFDSTDVLTSSRRCGASISGSYEENPT